MWAKAPHLHIYIEKPYSLLYMPWYFMYVTPHLKYRSCLGLSTTFFSIIFALTFSVFKCHYFLTGEMLKLCSYTHTHTYIYMCVCVFVFVRVGEEKGVYRILVGKLEWRRPLWRPRRRWVDNIRMGLQEVGYGYMDWIGLAQDRDRSRTLVSAVMNLRVLWNAGNFLTSYKAVSFSRWTLHHGVSK